MRCPCATSPAPWTSCATVGIPPKMPPAPLECDHIMSVGKSRVHPIGKSIRENIFTVSPASFKQAPMHFQLHRQTHLLHLRSGKPNPLWAEQKTFPQKANSSSFFGAHFRGWQRARVHARRIYIRMYMNRCIETYSSYLLVLESMQAWSQSNSTRVIFGPNSTPPACTSWIVGPDSTRVTMSRTHYLHHYWQLTTQTDPRLTRQLTSLLEIS